MAAPLPAERGTRSLSIEQELRAHLREMQPGSSQEAGEEGAEPDPLNRSRPERPVVTLPAEEEPVVDPATQRYRLLFLILLVLLVAGILVLAAAVVGLI
ncbi:MAG: hypothetical protein M5U01_12065 [Ardenticatenaceae bacterium]|nr:hypothetical protein [Ardenticatenaceae bacterium]